MKKQINWWDDPKNKEEVERISWWNHVENKETFPLPISVICSDNHWTVTCNSDTEKLLGDKLHVVASGDTKEKAIRAMFQILKWTHEYSEECRLNYQRFVPLRIGDWKHTGGKWFTIFGINFYFRYGKGMKGGYYIPFTKQNISIRSDWTIYKNWKKMTKEMKLKRSVANEDAQ